MARRNEKFDPLAFIPSASVVRERLKQVNEEARRLGILLRTAEEIERERNESAESAAPSRQTVASA